MRGQRNWSLEALANEGLVVSRRYAYLQPDDHVDAAYEKARWPIVAEQLQKARDDLGFVGKRLSRHRMPAIGRARVDVGAG